MSQRRSSPRLSRNNPSNQTLGEKLHPAPAPYEVPKGIKDGPPPLETQAPLPGKKSEMKSAEKAGGKPKKQKLNSTPETTVSVVIEDTTSEPMDTAQTVPDSTPINSSSLSQPSPTNIVNPTVDASTYNASEYQTAAKIALSRITAPLLTDASMIVHKLLKNKKLMLLYMRLSPLLPLPVMPRLIHNNHLLPIKEKERL